MSTELNKLRIDKSQRSEAKEGSGKGKWVALLLLVVLIAGSIGGYAYLNRRQQVTVDVVHPRMEASSDSAVLVASGYVVAHHKIEVGSKISGRVAWIGVEKGDHVDKDQIVVKLEDREYRASTSRPPHPMIPPLRSLRNWIADPVPRKSTGQRRIWNAPTPQLRADDASFKRIGNMVKQGVGAPQLLMKRRAATIPPAPRSHRPRRPTNLQNWGLARNSSTTAGPRFRGQKPPPIMQKSLLDATEIRCADIRDNSGAQRRAG